MHLRQTQPGCAHSNLQEGTKMETAGRSLLGQKTQATLTGKKPFCPGNYSLSGLVLERNLCLTALLKTAST